MTTRPKVNKVVLAYSGGLDTSIIVPWLKQHYGNTILKTLQERHSYKSSDPQINGA